MLTDSQPSNPDTLTADVPHEWTIGADVAAIEGLVDRIMAAVRSSRCAPGREDDVDLVLREALTNAVVHGSRGDRTARVAVSLCRRGADGLSIVVRDGGCGFDPTSVPSPVEASGLRVPHGRGIYLIQQLMDDVRFERGGAEVHMSVESRASRAAAATR